MKHFRAIGVTFCGGLCLGFNAAAGIVINEIHYNPDVATEPAEFVELLNTGPLAVNLAGWTLRDGGNLNYPFPATNVPPGGYVVVAQNPSALQAKFGVAGALGPMRPDGGSALSKYGEQLTLRNGAGQVQDEVEYQLGFPWPTVGDANVPGQGNSIELIHPSLDNNLGGSWRAAGGGAGTPGQNNTLLPAQATWKFVKGTAEASTPVTAWRQPAFDDSSWVTAALPIGYGEAFIATPLADMNGGYTSVFLRKQFVVNDPAQFTRLVLEAQYDDGFKCWINGVLVVDGTANMSAGEVPFSASAGPALENLNFVTLNLAGNPASLLVNGANTIAVQAHNSGLSGSSDFFFDARLIGQIGGSGGAGPSPGGVNTVTAPNAPPQARQVEHTPEQPMGGQPVRISAKVTDPDGVASVVLEYQVVAPGSYIEITDAAFTNAASWVSVAMNDAGASGDVTAGDDIFSAQIPGSVQVHRRLIRYRLTVADSGGRSVRVPYADDPQPNFAYFVYNGIPAWSGAVQPGAAGSNGVVRTISSNEMGRLPAFHLIGKSNSVATATWLERYTGDAYKWAGTLVYDGKVYDHIHYRARGGVWRYSMAKNMWKFDLNRGHDLEVKDNWGNKYRVPWTKLNLGSCIQQGDFNHRGEQGMFESVGFRLFNLAGVAAPQSSFCTFRVIDDAQEASPSSQYEGDFWGVYLAIEQENGRFLEEHDLPDGNLYKMESGTGELNNLGAAGPTDKSDLTYLQANYNNASEAWWRTNWNVANHYSYQAIVQGIHHYDIADGKNYFFYRNPETRLWQTCTWDLDLTWADNMYRAGQTGGDEPLKSRLLDNFANPGRLPAINIEFRNRVREIRDLLWNSDQAFKLIDEYASLLRGPTNALSILDADRSMWDYNPKMVSSTYTDQPVSKAGHGRFYQWPNEPTVSKNFNGAIQVLKNYVGYRSTNTTFSLDTIAADNARPSRPALTYTGPAERPLNRLSFRSSTYAGSNPFQSMRWRVGEVTDVTSPAYDPSEPSKYEIEAVWESGPITAFNADITIPAEVLRVGSRYRVRVLHTDTTGRNSQWSAPYEFTCGEPADLADLLNFLRITEVMFHPPPGGFEYIELYNSSTLRTLDLSGVRFSQGIEFTCPSGTMMSPGSYLLVAGTPNLAGFRAFYGVDPSVTVIGPFDGGLNNTGEQLTLRTAAGGSDIVEFNFSDGRGWPVTADGGGHSLVLSDAALPRQGAGAGEYGGNWHASTYLRGSAGRADTIPAPSLLINEVVAHTDFTAEFDSNDWIELYNPTDLPITLGPGWYLSDDASVYASLMKWAIPANTVIAAHGYVTFDEVTGFHNPTNIGFGLNKGGEQVFLSYLPGTAEDRVVDAVSFKAQENDWSIGRYPDGGPNWYALTPRSRNSANAVPPARAVISEVLFHPPDYLVGTNLLDNAADEFIEIWNNTAGALTFQNTNGVWRLNGGVDFNFPTNLTLAAGAYLVVVNFDPATNAAQTAAFKDLYDITQADLVGPYGGKLGNNSDRIALEKPQHGDGTNDPVNWVIVDEVIYADQAPFPCGSDGTGNSLQRLNGILHGSDPVNWTAAAPTAGRPRENLPAGLPSIVSQPQNRVVPTNGNATFSVTLCGTPPFTYQWRFQGTELTGATNATLTLFNVQPEQAGLYDVVISNPAGSLASATAALIVQYPPFISAQPQSTTTIRDLNASFSVTAGGTAPFNYQWRFNGANLPNATNDVLLLTGVVAAQAGEYSVLVSNSAGSALSASAILTVLIPATITEQPTNRTVTLAASPTNVSFFVQAIGSGTLAYQWRFNGADIPGATAPTWTVTNVQVANGGDFSVKVTDSIGSAISSNATLTVLVVPTVLLQPVSQTVVEGGNVTFSVMVSGNPPPFTYEWRKVSTPLPGQTFVVNDRVSFCTLTNVSATSTTTGGPGAYRVIIRNLASAGVASANAFLTVLPDGDGDGIPNAWEISNGLDPANNSDRNSDPDDDGMGNWEEYIAGTDPRNNLSYLKVQSLDTSWSSNLVSRIEFNAVSNRTYTVEGRDQPASGPWTRVADVPATTTNRSVIVLDSQPAHTPARVYRLATPRNP